MRSRRDFEPTGDSRVVLALAVSFTLAVVFLTVTGTALAASTTGDSVGQSVHPSDEPAFVVDLATDGSAEVVVTYTFDLETIDGTGDVTLSATWNGLAAVEDDTLVVTEPFASGFEPDRRFYLVGPDGYELESATPDPDERGDGYLAWEAGSDLDGFEVVASAVDGGSEDGITNGSDDEGDDGSGDGTATPDENGPGFGPLVALLALVAAAVIAGNRQGSA